MAVVTPVFLDTSVLLAGLIDLGPANSQAQRLMDGIAEGRVRRVQTGWHCCLEFYAVSTRLPPELRLDPSDALRLIETEILARFELCQLPIRNIETFLRSAVREGVAGGRIYDAHIAETARLAGARTIVTDNRRHFTSLMGYGIRVLSTEEFASGMA